MKNLNNIIEELKKISPLIMKIEKTEVYSVPLSYFNNLSAEIINKINSNKECAYYFGTFTPYSIPGDYFINLPEILLQKVLTNPEKSSGIYKEMEALAPLLNTISKKPVYSVPVNFFDTIQMPAVESQKEVAKIVLIKKRSKRFRLAAAAIIIPLLAIGLYTLTGKESIRSNNSNAKNEVKNLSKEEIVNFLKKTTSIENASSASQKTSINDNEFKSSLKQLSDKEIHQFLKETGESDEI